MVKIFQLFLFFENIFYFFQLSSVPYQILLYCNAWYFAFYLIAEILLLVYKGKKQIFKLSKTFKKFLGEVLPYPKYNLASEIILLFVSLGVEAIRNFFGFQNFFEIFIKIF